MVADEVWKALGNVKHYIEPFFGSGAVLLARPDYDSASHVETVCDKDGFVANVWRGIQFAPEEVAKWCDWPINHACWNAGRKELLKNEARLLENLVADPKWCDPVLAGYWIWAASCWIGRGLTRHNAIPHLGNAGMGVHAIGQIPHLSSAGMGVHAAMVSPIYDWMHRLSERLRRVRVVCGDWSRICGGDWQDKLGRVGIFFDPPYGVVDRDTDVYHHDSTSVAADVSAWALERGADKDYRIVIAGYDEHFKLLENGWTMKSWKGKGGYSNSGGETNNNRFRETLYFSPHCVCSDEMPLLKNRGTRGER